MVQWARVRFTAQKRSDTRNGGGTRRGASPLRRAIERNLDYADRPYPGTGAAGGMGSVFHLHKMRFLRAALRLSFEETGLEDEMKDADFVITGEGRLDSQTALKSSNRRLILRKNTAKVPGLAGCLTPDAGM